MVKVADALSNHSATEAVKGVTVVDKLKAELLELSSDTHQLHYIPKHQFMIIIIIIVDTVLRQKRNFKHEKQSSQQYRHIATLACTTKACLPPG